MKTRLSNIRDSFEGVIPSVIATTDADGVPNISYLSHVHYVDEQHVALSNQFFSKTAGNVRDRGLATVMVVDGRTGQQHMLDLQFRISTTEGTFFERAAAHLAVMSLSRGMADVMKLRSLEIYEVLACRPVTPAAPLAEPEETEAPRNRLQAVGRLCAAIAEQGDAEAMLDCALEGLETEFGFSNTVVLAPDEEGEKLSTIASRSIPPSASGASLADRAGFNQSDGREPLPAVAGSAPAASASGLLVLIRDPGLGFRGGVTSGLEFDVFGIEGDATSYRREGRGRGLV